MDAVDEIWAICESLFSKAARHAVEQLGLNPIDSQEMRPALARMRQHVPPSYLPFSTLDGALLAVHLFPDRELLDSPVVYIGIGSRSPQFVCGRFKHLPTGLWLWTAPYLTSKKEEFREASLTLAQEIEGAREVPQELWELLDRAPDGEPTWWAHRAEITTKQAWTLANVDHPFAELTDLDDENAEHAHAQLSSFLQVTKTADPLVQSALISAELELGLPIERDLILAVLRSEAWLGGEPAFRTDWSSNEDGLSEWSLALRASGDGEALRDTAFEPLRGHLDAYSGSDPKGAELLTAVSAYFKNEGEYANEIRQLRNAAFVSIYSQGGYSTTQCEGIAQACDRVSDRSFAAALARAIGQVSVDEA